VLQRWQRRFFRLFDDGELTFCVDEDVSILLYEFNFVLRLQELPPMSFQLFHIPAHRLKNLFFILFKNIRCYVLITYICKIDCVFVTNNIMDISSLTLSPRVQWI